MTSNAETSGRVFETSNSGTSGRVFEDFVVGETIRHPLGRTLTSTDNIWFTLLTVNPNPIHFDRVYAAKTEFKQPLVNSALTLALVTGLSVGDLSQNAVNLGWDKVRMPRPVFEGDTLYAQSKVLEKRESKSRPHQGIVSFKTVGFNQDGGNPAEGSSGFDLVIDTNGDGIFDSGGDIDGDGKWDFGVDAVDGNGAPGFSVVNIAGVPNAPAALREDSSA